MRGGSRIIRGMITAHDDAATLTLGRQLAIIETQLAEISAIPTSSPRERVVNAERVLALREQQTEIAAAFRILARPPPASEPA